MKTYWTPERIAEAENRFRNGESLTSIAQSHGKLVHVLCRALSLRGSDEWKSRTGAWFQTLRIPDDPAICAYIAGVTDSDGSMHVNCTPRGIYWRITVAMTCKEIPEWLSEFGGNLAIENRATVTQKTVYRWRVSRVLDLEHFLDRVSPYLRNPVRIERSRQISKWLSERTTHAHRGLNLVPSLDMRNH